jgi:hypothetical protein
MPQPIKAGTAGLPYEARSKLVAAIYIEAGDPVNKHIFWRVCRDRLRKAAIKLSASNRVFDGSAMTAARLNEIQILSVS